MKILITDSRIGVYKENTKGLRFMVHVCKVLQKPQVIKSAFKEFTVQPGKAVCLPG